uniref:PurM-like N-terminal domain-containing protein n=1 Tax=Glossina austeni TaxID=7395 RepID=A0A1A9UKB4_GLOAU
MKNQKHSLYKESGVDIKSAYVLINKIKSISRDTHSPEVMHAIGGFAALCNIPKNYHQPILVLSADGVGTKLRFAIDTNMHKNIGIDLVAMCIIKGIIEGCKISQCALVGGETSEMPGIIKN